MKGSVEQERQRRVLERSDGSGQDVGSVKVARILAFLHEQLVPPRPSGMQ